MCQKNGVPIPDSKRYEDIETGETWGPMRWPYNAKTDPTYNDPPITYIIEKRLKGIGTTWWNWKEKKSIRVGFDFDSLVGHAQGVGISEESLERISAIDIPWVEIVKSTRGLGRHLYIIFEEPYPITQNHVEHAALAKSMLPRLSEETGLDMEADSDACGGVMWIHHIDTTPENEGFKLVKKATAALTQKDIPPNWRDYLDVITGRRSKIIVRGYDPEGNETKGDEIDDLSRSYPKIQLDEVHDEIIDRLMNAGFSFNWNYDHHLAQTHTKALKDVFDAFAEEGRPLRGLFETTAPGTDTGKPNCFIRPRTNGAWDVYRFGGVVDEHELWDIQGGHTHTTFNLQASFPQLMKAAGGIENPDAKLGFSFSTVEALNTALKSIDAKAPIPQRCLDGSRAFSIKQRPDGKLVLTITKERSDKPVDFPGYAPSPKGWTRLLNEKLQFDKEDKNEERLLKLDTHLRALKQCGYMASESCGGSFDCWVIKDHTEKWVRSPRENISPFLKSLGYADIDIVIGQAIYRSWLLINDPFKDEYPGDRMWNRDAAQFRYQPANLAFDEPPHHPYWDKFLNHLGSDLDSYLTELPWTEEWGITRGGDYLKAWIASMFQFPFDKLPYIFFYGEQGVGKSMFSEAIDKVLITSGVVEIDRALTSEQGYNGELLNCILAVVEETDVGKAGHMAYNRLKKWVTGLNISIHPKYQQVFEARNSMHIVQMANNLQNLPIFPGDKRITAIFVPPFEKEIPKDTFLEHLHEEAPHFMHTLMTWELPEAHSRLRLPVVETESKQAAMRGSSNIVAQFLDEKCHHIAGAKVKFDDFYQQFVDSLDDTDRMRVTKAFVRKELNEYLSIHPMGRSVGNVTYIGNISFNEDHPEGPAYELKNGRLIKEGEQ